MKNNNCIVQDIHVPMKSENPCVFWFLSAIRLSIISTKVTSIVMKDTLIYLNNTWWKTEFALHLSIAE